jgi:hypothetical protein
MKPESTSFHHRNYLRNIYFNIILIFLDVKLFHVSTFNNDFTPWSPTPTFELCVQPIVTFLLRLCSAACNCLLRHAVPLGMQLRTALCCRVLARDHTSTGLAFRVTSHPVVLMSLITKLIGRWPKMQVKLSPCLVKYHIVTTWGGGGVAGHRHTLCMSASY